MILVVLFVLTLVQGEETEREVIDVEVAKKFLQDDQVTINLNYPLVLVYKGIGKTKLRTKQSLIMS